MLDQLIATSTFGIGYANDDGKKPTICVSRRQGDSVQCTVLPLAEFLDKVFAGFVPDPEMSKKLMEMKVPGDFDWVPAFPKPQTKEPTNG